MRAAVKRRAYGGGYGGGYRNNNLDPEEIRRRTEEKRERETQQFYMFQRSIISRGGVQPKDDAHWDALERRIFGQNHVKAGINFAKYDNIEVTPEGGTGKEQPISSMLCFSIIQDMDPCTSAMSAFLPLQELKTG